MKIIADPIHPYIKLDEDELAFVQSSVFQRLRNISQNGPAYLVYPSMTGSRFEHSLGVLHVATRIFDAVWNNMERSDDKTQNMKRSDDKTLIEEFVNAAKQDLKAYLGILCTGEEDVRHHLRKILRMAALFHDIGHLPLSHTFEEEFEGIFETNFKSWKISRRDLNLKLHEAFGLEIIRQILISPKEYGLDLNENVKKIYKGALLVLMADDKYEKWKKVKIRGERMFCNSVFATLHDIISGEYDADRADYILRDGYMSGTGFGRYDLDRFVQSLRLYKEEGRFKVVPTIRALSTLESYLIERYKIYKWINSHHKVRFFEKAASEMAKELFGKKELEKLIGEKYSLNTPQKTGVNKDLKEFEKAIREAFKYAITKAVAGSKNFQFPPFVWFENEKGELQQLNVQNFLQLDDLWFYGRLKEFSPKNYSSSLQIEGAKERSENKGKMLEISSIQQNPEIGSNEQNMDERTIKYLRDALLKRDPVSKSLWKDYQGFSFFCDKVIEKALNRYRKRISEELKKYIGDRIFLISHKPKNYDLPRDLIFSLFQSLGSDLNKKYNEHMYKIPSKEEGLTSLLKNLLPKFCKELESEVKKSTLNYLKEMVKSGLRYFVKENIRDLIASLEEPKVLSRDEKNAEKLRDCSDVLDRLSDLRDNISFFVYVVGGLDDLKKYLGEEEKLRQVQDQLAKVAASCGSLQFMIYCALCLALVHDKSR
jgi:HD superfamily phosphohydrolase